MNVAEVALDVSALLAASGLADTVLRIGPCSGGRNNRVYRVETPSRVFLAKRYFRHPTDGRDRLDAEYSFLQFAVAAGIRCVPRPIARGDRVALALYEFVEGRPLGQGDLSAEHIDQARDFLVALSQPDARSLAANLPPASEAWFSINEQLALVEQRLDALTTLPAATAIDAEVAALVCRMRQQWTPLQENVLTGARRAGLDPSAALELEDRCVSPSDLGYHNALVASSGRVTFLDFEYAGWDDPAKMVNDFFAQPAVPIPMQYFDRFLASVLAFSPNAAMLAERTRLLMPVFRMKWCCIVLNEYLPSARRRRCFAASSADETERKRGQLDMAQQLFAVCQVQQLMYQPDRPVPGPG